MYNNIIFQPPLNLNIHPIVIDYKYEDGYEEKIVDYLYKNYYDSFNYIFSTLTIEDRQSLLPKLLRKGITDIEIISERFSTGKTCEEHVINTGVPLIGQIKLLYSSMLRESDLPVVVIGTNIQYGKLASETIYSYLSDIGYPNLYYYAMSSYTESEGFNAVSYIRRIFYDSINVYFR